MIPMRRLLPAAAVAFALVLAATAGAFRAESHGKTGTLAMAKAAGAVLPTRAGTSIARVRCLGAFHSRCAGIVRLLPRGDATRQQVGSRTIARASVKLSAGATKPARLRLGSRARQALRSFVLNVTVVLSSGGKRSTRAAVVFNAEAATDNSKPHISVAHPPRGGGGTYTVKTYYWSWKIPVGRFQPMPSFRCPSDAPNVAANGVEVRKRNTRERIGLKGKLDANAKVGTGYGGFTIARTKRHDGARGRYPDYDVMVGWPAGGWTSNSVWAPVAFHDEPFNLNVTCTSSTDRKDIAYVNAGVLHAFMFPWS